MKLLVLIAALFATAVAAPAKEVPKIPPADAARLVAAGKAVLVDVREPAEWAKTGVAAPAVLLPKSDFDGKQAAWRPFLAQTRGKELILYCRTGHRAGVIAATLAAQGVAVANAGSLSDWIAAGLPVRTIASQARAVP